MWNSPRHAEDSPDGRRYSRDDLAALLAPLPSLLDVLRAGDLRDHVVEPMLRRMERDEFVLVLHELFVALFENEPVPASGHPGYLEAMIAELLDQCQRLVAREISHPILGEPDDKARRAAWKSLVQLCGERDGRGQLRLPVIEELELIYEDPDVHRNPLLTGARWDEILQVAVAGEFLWDEDWRSDAVLDIAPEDAWLVAEEAGIDLETTFRMPPDPSESRVAAAWAYLKGLAPAD